MPLQGRSRDALQSTAFGAVKRAEMQSAAENDVVVFRAEKLYAKFDRCAGSFQWFDASNDALFASDLPRRSYVFDSEGGRAVTHYMTRKENDYYCGLGETTGGVNKHGRRFVMQVRCLPSHRVVEPSTET